MRTNTLFTIIILGPSVKLTIIFLVPSVKLVCSGF